MTKTKQYKKCIKSMSEKYNKSKKYIQDVVKDVYLEFTDEVIEISSPQKVCGVSTPTQKECITRSKVKLYDYQVAVCEALRHQRGLICVHSVGSGKTLTAVAASQCFLDENPTSKVIVLTPASLLQNFKKELDTYGVKNHEKYVFMTHTKFANDAKSNTLDKNLIPGNMVIVDEIHNYKTAVKKMKLARWLFLKEEFLKPGKSSLAYFNIQKEIADMEKKNSVPMSYFVFKALIPAKNVLGLTATPIVNDPKDLLMQLSLITGQEVYNESISSDAKLAEILQKYGNKAFSFYERDKHDPRFPSYTVHKIEIVMPDDYLREYMKIETGEIDKAAKRTSEMFYGNIRQASNKIDNTNHSPKVQWVIGKIKSDISKGGRLVVYSSFIDAGIKTISDILTAEGIPHNFITGEVSKEKRTAIVKEYNSGVSPVLLISKAGGEGLDLKQTKSIIMLEPTWNPASVVQIFGRGVRNGSHASLPKNLQHVDCYVLLMVKPKPIIGRISGDKYLYTITESKKLLVKKILGTLDLLSLEGTPANRWEPESTESYIEPGGDVGIGQYEQDVIVLDPKFDPTFNRETKGKPRKESEGVDYDKLEQEINSLKNQKKAFDRRIEEYPELLSNSIFKTKYDKFNNNLEKLIGNQITNTKVIQGLVVNILNILGNHDRLLFVEKQYTSLRSLANLMVNIRLVARRAIGRKLEKLLEKLEIARLGEKLATNVVYRNLFNTYMITYRFICDRYFGEINYPSASMIALANTLEFEKHKGTNTYQTKLFYW